MRGKLDIHQTKANFSRITPAGAGKTLNRSSIYSKSQDHPRRCGENSFREANLWRADGSPPQVRGKPFYGIITSVTNRITPAGAGKTYEISLETGEYRDHPRRCGENVRCSPPLPLLAGSPPQVRGKLRSEVFMIVTFRITPAGAGKTTNPQIQKINAQDHPRRCGENIQLCCMDHTTLGSPPQVRGKPLSDYDGSGTNGITPAGAGKTMPVIISSITLWDHPRRCGENMLLARLSFLVVGSPPQVRGKLIDEVQDRFQDRITPAGAGKTDTLHAVGHGLEDHPRRCGENYGWTEGKKHYFGSPPQVRGKHGRTQKSCALPGITPAGAGKTAVVSSSKAAPTDHPRRCGENRND